MECDLIKPVELALEIQLIWCVLRLDYWSKDCQLQFDCRLILNYIRASKTFQCLNQMATLIVRFENYN